MRTELAAVLGKNHVDAFGGENLGKRQSIATQKRIDNFLETAAAAMRRMWYSGGHEKTLLGFSLACDQGGLHNYSQAWAKT
jgi:hypothetical protein